MRTPVPAGTAWMGHLPVDADANVLEAMRQAALGGERDAQFSLGVQHLEGMQGTRNFGEAARWLALSAQQGHPGAQTRLAALYEAGWGVPHSLTAAVRWLTAAAEQGYAEAQARLGEFYMGGWGVRPDHARALHWLQLAADAGHPTAQADLGRLLEQSAAGPAGPARLASAVTWYTRAAEQRQPDALYRLGHMLQHGLGTQQNLAEAARYYHLAAELGISEAEAALAALELASLSDEEGTDYVAPPPTC
mmetsp:Transcript_24592/g.61706  ORF Transcript_24592/g.61706 Transcript_24592/m.61706 type:complete len:249 (+) Transcript_24592:142-888(+)